MKKLIILLFTIVFFSCEKQIEVCKTCVDKQVIYFHDGRIENLSNTIVVCGDELNNLMEGEILVNKTEEFILIKTIICK